MVLTAIRGALGFLTRLPVGRSERAWLALGDAPVVMIPAGYVIGALAGLPLVLGGLGGQATLGTVAALLYVVALLAITGIAHVDGLADVGDALVVHGGPERRRAVMGDTQLGVGGAVAVGVDLVGLALAGLALSTMPVVPAIALVVAAEVGAKLAMVALAVAGEPAHPGMGEQLTGAAPAHLVAGLALAAPVGLLTWPSLAATVAVLAALASGLVVLAWARHRVGGVTGDVFGATNEVARLAALHAGVVAWTLY